MQTIELLKHMVRMQDVQTMQAQTIANMTKTLELACVRIMALESAMQRADKVVGDILGNTVLPKNKTRGRVIPLSLVARQAAIEIAGEK